LYKIIGKIITKKNGIENNFDYRSRIHISNICYLESGYFQDKELDGGIELRWI
jgi:hypothetical protein